MTLTKSGESSILGLEPAYFVVGMKDGRFIAKQQSSTSLYSTILGEDSC